MLLKDFFQLASNNFCIWEIKNNLGISKTIFQCKLRGKKTRGKNKRTNKSLGSFIFFKRDQKPPCVYSYNANILCINDGQFHCSFLLYANLFISVSLAFPQLKDSSIFSSLLEDNEREHLMHIFVLKFLLCVLYCILSSVRQDSTPVFIWQELIRDKRCKKATLFPLHWLKESR